MPDETDQIVTVNDAAEAPELAPEEPTQEPAAGDPVKDEATADRFTDPGL